MKKTFVFVCAVLAVWKGFTGCSHKNLAEPPTLSVAQVIAADTSFSLFQSLIEKAGLQNLLATAPSLTVFLPDNTAFAQAGITRDSITAWPDTTCRKLARYHLLGTALTSNKMQAGQYILTLQNLNLYVSVNNSGVSVNSVLLKKVNTACANGVIQVIAKVLTPPVQTIMQVLQADTSFSLLTAAITKDSAVQAGFSGLFNNSSIYTLFAPTNTALRQSGDSIRSAALIAAATDSAVFNAVNRYLVTGYRVTGDFIDNNQLISVHGDTLILHTKPPAVTALNNGVRPDSILLSSYDRLTTNGVVHVIQRPFR